MPLSAAGGIKALLSVFRAAQTLLNEVCAGIYGDQHRVCGADDLKPMSGPWSQEESQKGVAISLVLTTCNSNASD